MTAASSPLAVSMRGISKSFGAVRANRGASLAVPIGEIHALVGENGAGKSTLMRILSGAFPPDDGTVEVAGREGTRRDVTGWTTADAIAAGVGMVHQHFMLVPRLTVAENVVLGRELTRHGSLDAARAERDVAALAARTGLDIPADCRVADLSVGEAQRVEIVKTLYRGARILILDEPTAVLSPPEVRQLWEVLRRLRDEGGTIVLITHKLDEVIEISDAITVMRQGETVARMRTGDTSPAEIARAMVGREVQLVGADAAALGSVAARGAPPEQHDVAATVAGRHRTVASGAAPSPAPAPALAVRGLEVHNDRGLRAVDQVGFDIAPGEIFGIAGVEGNGQTELVETLAGLRAPRAGTIRLGERDVTALGVRARGDAGLSHIPEDRHERGLILEYSVADNLILGQQHHFARGAGALDRERIRANAGRQIAAFDIRPADAALPARALSGGNQQKIVIAREMGRDFSVLLAAQPTRGVDVGAIEFIHARLRDARAAGKAILLVSADLAEVLALSDRIAVMYGGRFVAVLPRADATAEIVGRYMTGARLGDAA